MQNVTRTRGRLLAGAINALEKAIYRLVIKRTERARICTRTRYRACKSRRAAIVHGVAVGGEGEGSG